MGYVNKRRSTASSQGISLVGQKAKKKHGTVGLTVFVKAKEVTLKIFFQFLAQCLFFHHHYFPSDVEPEVLLIQLYCFASDYFLTASSMAVNLYSLRVCFTLKVPNMSTTWY